MFKCCFILLTIRCIGTEFLLELSSLCQLTCDPTVVMLVHVSWNFFIFRLFDVLIYVILIFIYYVDKVKFYLMVENKAQRPVYTLVY